MALSDCECVDLLKWSLPGLDLHWPGFHKVRGQVCKRIKRRVRRLGLDGFQAYRARLEADPAEWHALDDCCHITISRFFRDKGVFDALRGRILPALATRALQERRQLRCWSAGSASGEEAYSLRLLWDLELAAGFPATGLEIIATDIDEAVLQRARQGCYRATSLRDLPAEFLSLGFDKYGELHCVKPRHRRQVRFLRQDLRREAPAGLFDLILCRNLAFTYFAPAVQRRVLAGLLERLRPHGYLAIGVHEHLPAEENRLLPLDGVPQVFEFRDRGEEIRS